MSITLTEPVAGLVKRIVVEDNGITYLQDIAAVSDAEGWSPAFQQIGNGIYICPYELFVFGETDFRIGFLRPETLSFNYARANNNSVYALYITCESLRIGRLSPNDRRFNYGGNIHMNDTYRRGVWARPTELLEIHNSSFQYLWYFRSNLNGDGEGNISNLIFNYVQFGVEIGSKVNVKNVFHTGGFYGLNGEPLTVDGLSTGYVNMGMIMTGNEIVFNGVSIPNEPQSGNYTYVRVGNTGTTPKNIYFVDSIINRNGLAWYTGGSQGETLNTQHLQTTTEIIIFDEDENELEGAVVEISNNEDEIVFSGTTDENGKIETVLTYFSRSVYSAGGSFGENIDKDFEPFKIIVTKDGYETYKLQNTTVIEGEKTIIRAQLKPQKPLMIGTNGGIMLKLNPENTGDDRDLGIML